MYVLLNKNKKYYAYVFAVHVLHFLVPIGEAVVAAAAVTVTVAAATMAVAVAVAVAVAAATTVSSPPMRPSPGRSPPLEGARASLLLLSTVLSRC